MIILSIILMLFVSIIAIWAYWIWKNRNSKSKGTIIFHIIFFIAIFLLVGYKTRIIPGSQKVSDLFYVKGITGKTFWVEEVYKVESPRAFNGDGHSIHFLSFSENVAIEFIEPDSLFFQQYPKSSRDHWEKVKWKKTPNDSLENNFVDFAVWVNSTLEESNKDERIKLIRSILKEEGNYYAYSYYMHSERIGDIDFYILSPKRKLLICINHNT